MMVMDSDKGSDKYLVCKAASSKDTHCIRETRTEGHSLFYSSTYSHDLAAVLVGFPKVAQKDREPPRYSLHVTV
jgi:hypothetical protein